MASKIRYKLGFYVFVACLFDQSNCNGLSERFITSCLGQDKPDFSITCQKYHVISYLDLDLGVSNKHSCDYDTNDCFGSSANLSKQRNRCFWKRKCNISVNRKHVLSQTEPGCIEKYPDYLRIGMPKCIHKDTIHTMCSSAKFRNINTTFGLIRSHSSYPNTYTGPRKCKRRIKIPRNSTLKIQLYDRGIEKGDKLRLRVSGTKKAYNLRSLKIRSINVPNGSVELVWKVRSTKSRNKGFVLKYQVVENSYLKTRISLDEFNIQHGDGEATLQVERIGSIQECASPKETTVSIHCPKDALIYSPEVFNAVSRRPHICLADQRACKGLSPELLVQKNECYWKPTCNVTVRGVSFIVSADRFDCIGRLAGVTVFSGFKCVLQDRVQTLCGNTTFTKSSKRYGMIRSHHQYPWHYKTQPMKCQQSTRIGRNRQLYIHFVDVDLDTRDKFTVYHINKGCKNLVADNNSTNTKVILTGGRVTVNFQIGSTSRSGRGFLLTYMIATTKVYSSSNGPEESCRTGRLKKKNRRRQRNRRKKLKTAKSSG